MWDYDKLFAVGNIVGIKNTKTNELEINLISDKDDRDFYIEDYGVYTLDYPPANEQIQYIIRLDEHDNIAERVFDRERDMKPKLEPMPELKDGMFIRVIFGNNYLDQNLGFINLSRGQIIYQEGGYDWICNIKNWKLAKIVEVYDPETLCFYACKYTAPIWRSPEYQSYLDAKVQQ